MVSIGILLLLTLAPWLRRQEFTTLPDVIKKLYGDHTVLSVVTTVMAIAIPFGWVNSQMVSFGKLFSMVTTIPMPVLIIMFAVLSLVFVLPAGLASVAWTDFIFGAFMFLVMIITTIFTVNAAGGWSDITEKIPGEMSSFPNGMFAVGGVTILMWAFSVLPGTLTNQIYYQRIFAAKNANILKRALIITAIILVFKQVWTSIVGISIHSMNPNLEDPEMAAGWFLTQVPIWVLAIFGGLIIAVTMSTISSSIQSVVVNLTRDIYRPYINPNASEKKVLRLSRIISIVIVALGAFVSILFPTALSWLVDTFAYSAAGLLVPIFLGFALRKRQFLTWQGALWSMIVGVLGSFAAQILGTEIPYVIYGIVGSLLAILLVSALTRNKTYSRSDYSA